MITLLTILALVAGLSTVVFLSALRGIPDGHEDDHGFHVAVKNAKPKARKRSRQMIRPDDSAAPHLPGATHA